MGKNFTWWAAIPIYHVLVSIKKESCKDEHLVYSINNAFYQTDEKTVRLAQEIAFKKCWHTMKEKILTDLEKENGYYLAHVCPELKKLSALSPKGEAKCSGQDNAQQESKSEKADQQFAQVNLERVNPHGRHFEGPGIKVEMAIMAEKNTNSLYDVLLKISGEAAYQAGIDGKIKYYFANHGGSGVDFKSEEGLNRMASRSPWGNWQMFEVYLDGKTIKVYQDAKKSDKLKPEELLKAYKKDLGK